MISTNPVVKSRRGATRHVENPFVAKAAANSRSGTKRISNKAGDKFMIVSEQGEVMAPVGFHQVVEVDKTQFVKLYVNGVKAFQGLKSAGARVFELIYRAVQDSPGTDRIHLHFMEIDQVICTISRATFDRGMTELLEKEFIAEAMSPGLYYLNIDYMFNGNRLAFVKEYRIASTNSSVQKSTKNKHAPQVQKRLDGLD